MTRQLRLTVTLQHLVLVAMIVVSVHGLVTQPHLTVLDFNPNCIRPQRLQHRFMRFGKRSLNSEHCLLSRWVAKQLGKLNV